MRRNGMCPLCYLRRFFVPAKPFIDTYSLPPIDNGAPPAPLMGWSSWNTYRNRIDEGLIIRTAQAMRDKGLLAAGYRYVNLDDNWHSSMRTPDGRIQGDPQRFPCGIRALADALHQMGFRMGLYSSNGTHTCEDLPASLHREYLDADTFAALGAEYLKYDYCHHQVLSKYAPLVYGIQLSRGGEEGVFYDCKTARLWGTAKWMRDDKVPCKCHVSGLDANGGYMEYDITVPAEGDYVLTVCIRKKGSRYQKCLAALVNRQDIVLYDIPAQKKFNYTARFQQTVHLAAGQNTVRLFNPVTGRADSAFLQYYTMGKALRQAAHDRKGEYRPIVYSICEWGWNQPYRWGAIAGNMWRTTPDIRPVFWWIKLIYDHTVKLYRYAHAGAFNDPDMLEVGNGRLGYNQNVAHFSLWCMMSAPLVLGNDIEHITQAVLDIVTNPAMIAIDQDPLCKPCKRLRRGAVDVLAKPLTDNRTAICLFNRTRRARRYTVTIDNILRDAYIDRPTKTQYTVRDVWQNSTMQTASALTSTVDAQCVKVYIVQ